MYANRPVCRAASSLARGSVAFRRYPAPREIRDVVESIWTFSSESDDCDLTEYVPPDICSAIICRTDIEPFALIRGPQFELGEIPIPSRARYVGARLRPGAVSWFLSVAAKDVCGSRITLDAMSVAIAPSRIGTDSTPRDVVKRFVQALIEFCGRRGSTARATIGATAVEIISRKHGKISADTVASELGCSARHLRRTMIAEIGMGPKAAARIARIRRAIDLLATSNQPLAQVALDAGYGDQPHMTKEFAVLKAPSPARMRRWSESDFANTREPASY